MGSCTRRGKTLVALPDLQMHSDDSTNGSLDGPQAAVTGHTTSLSLAPAHPPPLTLTTRISAGKGFCSTDSSKLPCDQGGGCPNNLICCATFSETRLHLGTNRGTCVTSHDQCKCGTNNDCLDGSVCLRKGPGARQRFAHSASTSRSRISRHICHDIYVHTNFLTPNNL